MHAHRLWLHHLDKPKHLVGPLVGIVLLVVHHGLLGDKMLAPKLVDLKAALVDVKMDVPLLKIRRAGLPDHRLGMQRLDRLPRAKANALAVLVGRRKEDLQMVVVRFPVDLEDHAPHALAVRDNAIGLVVGRVDATLDSMFIQIAWFKSLL